MIYLLYNLLKRILFLEQEWCEILRKKQLELDEQQRRIDSLFRIFDILSIKKKDIPDKDDFILKFKRVDMAINKDFEQHPEKYAIIEEDK